MERHEGPFGNALVSEEGLCGYPFFPEGAEWHISLLTLYGWYIKLVKRSHWMGVGQEVRGGLLH